MEKTTYFMNSQTTSQDKGITLERNKNHFFVFKLHYSADEEKSEQWALDLKSTYPSLDIWRQEMELDFTKSTGLRLYPEFSEQKHVRDNLKAIPYKHIYRFWDFGYRHPAVIFAQQNAEDQLVLLDELIGNDIVILEFGKQIKRITKRNYPGWEIEDFCDPAGKFKSDKSKYTTLDILRTLDIRPKYTYRASEISSGINLIRTLLLDREDGQPNIIVDKKCKITIDAFLGGYIRDELTDEAIKDGFYEHPMDALRYGVVNLYSCRDFKPIVQSVVYQRNRKTADAITGY